MFVTPIIKACLKPEGRPNWTHFAMFWMGWGVLRAWDQRPPQSIPYAQTWPKIYNTVFSCLTNSVLQIPFDKISRTKLEQALSPLHSRLTPVGKLTKEDCKIVWSNVNNPNLQTITKIWPGRLPTSVCPQEPF